MGWGLGTCFLGVWVVVWQMSPGWGLELTAFSLWEGFSLLSEDL